MCPCRCDGDAAGFSMLEMLMAMAITLAVTGAIFALFGPAQGTFQAQPEVSDVQQRLRVVTDVLTKDLVMAGAGKYTGSSSGSLFMSVAPVMPYRMGDVGDDPKANVFYRPDTITVMYVPETASQTTIRDPLTSTATSARLNIEPNCPPSTSNEVCGLADGMGAMIFDQNGAWDPVTIAGVAVDTVQLAHDGQLAAAYAAGANIAQVSLHTYYLKPDAATNSFQLVHYDGHRSDFPVVDHVVKLTFEYFGEPAPPQLLPNKLLTDVSGPWTTYGPRPPTLGTDNSNDTWSAGENCIFQVVGGQQVPRLPPLSADVGEVKLEPQLLIDGPWCPDSSQPDRFDADLLRVRRIRAVVRVEAAAASLRGPAGILFSRGGTSNAAERYIPDQEIRFDVSPRNLNLAR